MTAHTALAESIKQTKDFRGHSPLQWSKAIRRDKHSQVHTTKEQNFRKKIGVYIQHTLISASVSWRLRNWCSKEKKKKQKKTQSAGGHRTHLISAKEQRGSFCVGCTF